MGKRVLVVGVIVVPLLLVAFHWREIYVGYLVSRFNRAKTKEGKVTEFLDLANAVRSESVWPAIMAYTELSGSNWPGRNKYFIDIPTPLFRVMTEHFRNLIPQGWVVCDVIVGSIRKNEPERTILLLVEEGSPSEDLRLIVLKLDRDWRVESDTGRFAMQRYPGQSEIALADFDGDGDSEIAVLGHTEGGCNHGAFFRMDRCQAVRIPTGEKDVDFLWGWGPSLDAKDVDGDGSVEICTHAGYALDSGAIALHSWKLETTGFRRWRILAACEGLDGSEPWTYSAR